MLLLALLLTGIIVMPSSPRSRPFTFDDASQWSQNSGQSFGPQECLPDVHNVSLVCFHMCSNDGTAFHYNCSTQEEVHETHCEGHGHLPWPKEREWRLCEAKAQDFGGAIDGGALPGGR